MNAEDMSLNPIEASKSFLGGLIRNCLDCDYNCDGHIPCNFYKHIVALTCF